MIRDRDGDAYGPVILTPGTGTARMAMLISNCPTTEGVSVGQISPLIARDSGEESVQPHPGSTQLPPPFAPEVEGIPFPLRRVPRSLAYEPGTESLPIQQWPPHPLPSFPDERMEGIPVATYPPSTYPTIPPRPSGTEFDRIPARRSLHSSTFWNGVVQPTPVPAPVAGAEKVGMQREIISETCGVVGDSAALIWKNDRFGSWVACRRFDGDVVDLRWWDVINNGSVDGERCAKVDLEGVGVEDEGAYESC